jgi:uncharacterized membrane protein YheB (UPF0754 family)
MVSISYQGFSFVGIPLSMASKFMQLNPLMFLFPFVGALIGWFTNYLAVRMLFRPREAIDLKLFTLQGLLPKRRKEVATNIATTIEKELLSVNDISQVLANIDWGRRIEPKVSEVIRQRLDIGLLAKLPLGRTVRKRLLPLLENIITKEIIHILANLQADLVSGFRQQLDLHAIVFNRIDRFDMQQLENVVLKVARRELRHIELVGAVLGFLIGLTQVALLLLI